MEGMYFLWLEGHAPYVAGRITTHMAYNYMLVEYLDPYSLEPLPYGQMVIQLENVARLKWMLFHTEHGLIRAVGMFTRETK